MNYAKNSIRNFAFAALPIVVALLAVIADRDLMFATPIPIFLTVFVGFYSYVQSPEGHWWRHASIAGFFGFLVGIAFLFYVGSRI